MKKWILIAFVVVTALLAGLIVYGVRTHKEAGLLNVCFDARGPAIYDTSHCGATEVAPIRWDHAPVTIGLTVINDHEEARATRFLRRAVESWNQQLGYPALAYRAALDGRADALLTWGTAIEAGQREGGAVTHSRNDGKLRADGEISAIAIDEIAYRVTFHELGHVLGLAHDDFEDSAMFAVTAADDPTSTAATPIRVSRVTDSDRALLRALYMRR